jgi:hypothetical protein
MVPIGEVELLSRQVADQAVVRLECSEGMEQPVAIARAPFIGPWVTHHVVVARGAVEVDGEDRRELGPGGVEQGQPIGLWSGHGVLVGPHPAAERLQQEAHRDPLHRRVLRSVGSSVPVVIGRWIGPALERAI